MDGDIEQNSPQEPASKPAPPTQGGPVSYTRSNNPSPNFFDKFFSIFTKKTVAGLVILILVIGIGAATIAVQRSTEIRQLAATAPTPPCNIPVSLLTQLGLPPNTIRGYGDVNGRDGVTSVDSALILQKEAGLITLTPVQLEAADVNGPPNVLSSAGNVSSVDSTLILQYVAALITTFPSVCSSSPTPTPTRAPTPTPTPTRIPTPTTPPGVTAPPTPTPIRTPTPTVPPSSAPPCNIPASLGVGTGGYGDVNGDGQVNPIDSTLILQFSAGLITFTPAKIEAADVNGAPNVLSSAGDVTSVDSTLILQYAAGLINTFPVCSSSPTPTPTPTPTTSPIPDCNSGSTCTACTAPANTCGGTGTQICTLTTHSGGGVCNQVNNTVACTTAPNNCNVGNVCINNQCAVPTGNPTPTPTPTGTGGLQYALHIGLDGLGTTGDNGGPNGTRSVPTPPYNIPKRPTRNITIEFFNSSNNQQVGTTKTGTVIYASDSGVFAGIVDMGSAGFAPGSYNIKIKSDGYLKRKILGVALTTGTDTIPPVSLFAGDIDGNNALNILDINILISCSTTTLSTDNHQACNANPSYAILSDLDDNGVVDLSDANLLIREFSVQNGD